MRAATRPAPLWKRLALAAALIATVLPLTACAALSPAFYACLLSAIGTARECRTEAQWPGPPSPPTDLYVQLVGSNDRFRTDVVWTWPPERDVDSITVYRSTTRGGPYAPIDWPPVDSGSGAPDGLDDDDDGVRDFGPCATVYYVARALDYFGNWSAFSEEVSAPMPCHGEAVVTGLHAAPDNRAVELDWDDRADPDLLGYDIYRTGHRNEGVVQHEFVKINAALVTSPAYTDPGRRNGDELFYRVLAVYRDGRGALSGVVSATPSADDAFDWGLVASAREDAVRLTWSSSAHPAWAAYRIYRSGDREGTLTQVGRVPTTQGEFVDAGVTNGREYFYRLRIEFTSGDESTDSPLVSTTPFGAAPLAPTGLVATPGDASVGLEWDDNAEGDLAGYDVYRADQPNGFLFKVNSQLVTESAFVVPSLENGREQFFWVRAVDADGLASDFSSMVSATPGARPAAPAGLAATASDTRVALDWDDSSDSGVAGYNVYAAPAASGAFERRNDELLAVSAYTDLGLPNGIEVFYRVTAVDAAGNESDPSAVVSATPRAGEQRPAAPTGLTAAPGDHLVALDWADNPEADLAGYDVELATAEAGPFGSALRRPVTVSQHTVVDLPVQPFFFRVVAVDAAGNRSEPSAVVSATPCPAICTGPALSRLLRPAAASTARPSVPFALTVAGAFDRGGTSRLEGETIAGTGFGFTGTFVLEPALKGLDPELKELAAGGLGGSWHAVVDWRLAPGAGAGTTSGIALAAFADPRVGAACLRFEDASTVKKRGSSRRVVTNGTFTFLGGTEAAARLLGAGSYRVEPQDDGRLRYHGQASRAAGGAPLPDECLALREP